MLPIVIRHSLILSQLNFVLPPGRDAASEVRQACYYPWWETKTGRLHDGVAAFGLWGWHQGDHRERPQEQWPAAELTNELGPPHASLCSMCLDEGATLPRERVGPGLDVRVTSESHEGGGHEARVRAMARCLSLTHHLPRSRRRLARPVLKSAPRRSSPRCRSLLHRMVPIGVGRATDSATFHLLSVYE